ncbi:MULTISPECIES: hypothetical protein [unclassified Mesorhizobium]|uniref:ABC transporter permease n=1 Tax=unclassified Mesorhizobium TaxID=325217 RepID=UPI00333D2FD9
MSSPRSTTTSRLGRFGLGLTAMMVLAFLMAPLIIIVLFSFKSSGDFTFPITGWSLKWYREFFSMQTWMDALRNSLVLAVSTTLLATPLGTMAALGLAAPNLPGRRTISALLLVPMIAPVVIVGVGMYFVFSMAGLTATLPGLILGHTSLAVPFVVVTMIASTALGRSNR